MENSSPRINITLCGKPQPAVHVEFIDPNVKVTNATINSFTYNYTLQLPRLTPETCGKELTITATGFNNTRINDTTKIFLENCKYNYYDYIVVLNHFNQLAISFFRIFLQNDYSTIQLESFTSFTSHLTQQAQPGKAK